jgi:hypothetical protein
MSQPHHWRRRWRVFLTGTWFPGFQTVRTYIAPFQWETHVFIVPGVGVGYQWGWIGYYNGEQTWRRWVPW